MGLRSLLAFLLGAGVLLVLQSCSPGVSNRVMDNIFADYASDQPGAAVMVLKDGIPQLTRCYGLANLETETPVTPVTNFRLASVTKQFTATAILILVERGELDLKSRLSQYLPELPAYSNAITLEQVLSHTSGLVDYESVMDDTATIQVDDIDVVNLVASVDTTYFIPGTQYQYSNSGYALLAVIVERVSGMSFPNFLKTEIFAPLGMENTLAFVKGRNTIPNRAMGYHVHGDTVEFSDQSPTSAVLGDGGIYTSLDDMAKWDRALTESPLISKALRERSWTPGLEDYGFGWRINEYKGHRRIHHTGGTCGFSTVYIRFPDDDLSVIVFSNRREPGISGPAYQLIDHLID